jgi:hypothetical protein
MKLLNNRLAAFSLLLLTGILYIVLSLTIKLPLDKITHNIWKGYYILALEESAPVDSILNTLEDNNDWEVISEFNTTVQVFSHANDYFIPVSELTDHYIENDPLYDPFLKKLPLLFKGRHLSDNYYIFYIKSQLNNTDFSKRIKSIMDNYSCEWLVPEIKYVNQTFNMIIFAAAFIILLIWNRVLWPLLLSGIFPWIQFAYSSGLPGVLVSIIFIFSLILMGSVLYKPFKHYLNLGKFDPISKFKLFISILIMILSFLYLLINLRSLYYIAAFIITVLAHFSFIIFYIIIMDYRRKIQQHRMFFPVRIKYGIKIFRSSDLYIFSILILIIIISPILIHENSFESDITIPVPLTIEGVDDFSQTSIQILHNHSLQSELPNISDYISHMMFLETYSYGFKYSFPIPHLTLSVPIFIQDGTGVKEENIDIFMFTDRWYESIIDNGLSPGISKLLISQDSPSLIGYQSEFGDLLSGNYMRNHYWFSIVLVVSILFWLSNFSPSAGYVLKEFLLRRKQQVV